MHGLEVRLLGNLQVHRQGEEVPLPPSKKTRALLAYLLLSGRAHRRERLCEMLWDVTEDPRGALRWSLSRLRAVLDDESRRLVADRERVRVAGEDIWLDLHAVREETSQGVASLPTDRLAALSDLFRGELLDGLYLAEFQDFSAWCVAERESARKLHARILATLVERNRERPDSALRYARKLKRVDPFDESVRARLVRLLVEAGRPMEAEEQYRAASRALHEAGVAPSGELLRAYGALRNRPCTPAAPAESSPGATSGPAVSPPSPVGRTPLVGREQECTAAREAVDAVMLRRRAAGVLITGEAGLGKTRLLEELIPEARERGALVIQSCSYEPERRRPFGPWIDALTRLPESVLTPDRRAALGPLLPGGDGGDGAGGDRERLLAAVSGVVTGLAADVPLLALVFDDIQWLDEASAALIHYVVRMNREAPLLLVMAGRRGEMSDNPEVQQVIQALRREELLQVRRLPRLSADATARLVDAVAPGIDPGRVFGDSAGNPLYAIELARAMARGDSGDGRHSYADVVRDRIGRLPEEAMEVLRWASVAGAVVRVDVLEALPRFDLEGLTRALEILEIHGLLAETGGQGISQGSYRFSHELVRRVVVSDLSHPRRRLMHLHVARILETRGDASGDAATELADHAARGGDTGMAARACVRAAERCLRVFASTEAEALARRGMRYAETLEEPDRVTLMLELTQIRLYARRPADPAKVAAALELLAEQALDQGCLKHARMGFYLLSLMRWESGDWSDAWRFSMRVEELGRTGNEQERLLAIGTTAQCLVLLERDLPEAEAMLLEAMAMGDRAGNVPAVVLEAQGMLRLHGGDLDAAARLLHRCREVARRDGERLGEFNALEHLVCLELQRGQLNEATRLSLELLSLGERFRQGSEAPFARALNALSRYAGHDPAQLPALEEAVEALRQEDAKHRLAFVLNRMAHLELKRGEPESAWHRAEAALEAARTLNRASEVMMALTACCAAARALGDDEAATRYRESIASAHTELLSREAVDAMAILDLPPCAPALPA